MQYQRSNCLCGPVFEPLTDSIHSAVISPLLACDRLCRFRSYTSGSPLLVRPTAACIGPGTNDTDHLCGALAVRTGMESFARLPLRVRRSISPYPPGERHPDGSPTGLLLSGRCTPVPPDSRTESFRRLQ